ncbi:hypothetical protein BD413DRAFT_535478 [Trametes elegans]|nr:hypothetical protein BD413DRAFT_535478 [Trametes elegans]
MMATRLRGQGIGAAVANSPCSLPHNRRIAAPRPWKQLRLTTIMSADELSAIPLAYRLFFLYIEPISAIVGAFYAGLKPTEYLTYLAASAASVKNAQAPPTPTLISLYQLANLYVLFALNEHFVLSSTRSRRTWRWLLFGLLVADLGHLATMVPLAQEKGYAAVFLRCRAWNAMEWGSVGFVYAGATMRTSFLLGVGLRGGGRSKRD